MRSLVILTRLRLGGVLRRWRRSLARPKGLLVTILMALIVIPWFGFMIVMPFLAPQQQPAFPAWIDRFGPAGLMALLVVSVLSATGEAALYFAPAEIDLLFTGPYSRRQLIGYKLSLVFVSSLGSAIFFSLIGRSSSGWFVAGFVGSVLLLMLLQLSQMVVGLGINTLGTLIWSRTRQVVLLGLIVVVTLVIFPSRATLLATDWRAFGLAVERSPVTAIVLTPFAWFVRTYTARDLPTLLRMAVPAAIVDFVLVGLVFALDASYLEASASASARRLARFRKAIAGGATVKMGQRRSGWLRFRPPNPAWWGGMGPNFWRQMVSALGDPNRILFLTAIFAGGPYLLGAYTPRGTNTHDIFLATAPTIILPATLFLSMLLAYDFRGDLNVMETLKMLPIRPTRLAFGQVLTPTILASFLQASAAMGLLVGVGGLPGQEAVIGLALLILLPANLYFFVVENLLFLWFPTRLVAGQFDGVAVIRQMILLLAKGVACLIAGLIAAGVGVGAFFLLGHRLEASLVVVWLTLLILALSLLPVLGQAFTRFDVTHDIPAP